MPGDRHDWNNLDHYIGIHDACLKRFEHFVEQNSIAFAVTGSDSIQVRGRIACAGGVYLEVRKTLELNQRNQVRTIRYAYHAGIMQKEDRSIFRYDNAHRYDRAGHPDEHHKHLFDQSGREARDPVWIGRERWPTLSEVLEELEDWWLQMGFLQPSADLV